MIGKALLLGGMLAWASASAMASDAAKPTPEQKPEQAPATESAMRVYLDPETGQLSPVPVTPEQMVEDELLMQQRSLKPMEQLERADGTVTLRLNGNFELASTMVIGPDGRLVRVCTEAHAGVEGPHVHPVLAPREER